MALVEHKKTKKRRRDDDDDDARKPWWFDQKEPVEPFFHDYNHDDYDDGHLPAAPRLVIFTIRLVFPAVSLLYRAMRASISCTPHVDFGRLQDEHPQALFEDRVFSMSMNNDGTMRIVFITQNIGMTLDDIRQMLIEHSSRSCVRDAITSLNRVLGDNAEPSQAIVLSATANRSMIVTPIFFEEDDEQPSFLYNWMLIRTKLALMRDFLRDTRKEMRLDDAEKRLTTLC